MESGLACPPDWEGLRLRLQGQLSLPDTGTSATARLIQNPRFDAAQPLAVVPAATTNDVVEAVRFAEAAAGG